MRRVAQAKADVVHGHGAKGGAYARMVFGNKRAVRAYTPHGGSLLFGHDTLDGKFYLATERLLMLRGDLFLFESAYSAEVFAAKSAIRAAWSASFITACHVPSSNRCTARRNRIMFMGELRHIKGIDVLIDAIALMHRNGRNVTATLVGDGPDREPCRPGRAGICTARPNSCRPWRRGRLLRLAASWWPRRGTNPCLTWCWRRPQPASR